MPDTTPTPTLKGGASRILLLLGGCSAVSQDTRHTCQEALCAAELTRRPAEGGLPGPKDPWTPERCDRVRALRLGLAFPALST